MPFLNGVDIGFQMCSTYIEGTDHIMSTRTKIGSRILGIFICKVASQNIPLAISKLYPNFINDRYIQLYFWE